MSTRLVHGMVAALALVGFGVLMALRAQPSSFGARVAVAVLAGACLGLAMFYATKAAPRRGGKV